MEGTSQDVPLSVDSSPLGSQEEEEAPLFGLLDVLILLALLGFAIYWLFLRRKKAPTFDPAAIKTFSIETNIQKADNTSFIGKMKSTGRNIVIFYGSQTGTAEEFAARLAKEANRFGLKAMVADPEECEMEDLTKLPEITNSMAIFCMATYGEGDPTDNAQDFYQWLQDGSVDLPGVNYALTTSGRASYGNYCCCLPGAATLDECTKEPGSSTYVEQFCRLHWCGLKGKQRCSRPSSGMCRAHLVTLGVNHRQAGLEECRRFLPGGLSCGRDGASASGRFCSACYLRCQLHMTRVDAFCLAVR